MKLLALCLLSLTLLPTQAKPPKSEYDKAEDRTYYSTGKVRFRRGSDFAYVASFSFRGKTDVTRPENIEVVFSTRRTNEANDPAVDRDYMKWNDVEHVTLRWTDEPKEYESKSSKEAETDDMILATASTFKVRYFIEKIKIKMPIDDFVSLANAKELTLKLGNHTDTLKENVLTNMKTLAATIPPKPEG